MSKRALSARHSQCTYKLALLSTDCKKHVSEQNSTRTKQHKTPISRIWKCDYKRYHLPDNPSYPNIGIGGMYFVLRNFKVFGANNAVINQKIIPQRVLLFKFFKAKET